MAISTPPTYAEFVAKFPAFGTIEKSQVEAQLAASAKYLCDLAWDEWYGEGVELEAAHNLFLLDQACKSGAQAGTAGPETSVSAAGVSIGYAQPTWNDKSKRENWYMKTIYGQMLLRLWDTVIAPGCMAT